MARQGGRTVRGRHPWFQAIVSGVAASCVRAWHSTLRVRMHSMDGSRHPWDPRKRPCIYAIWHDSIFAVLRARVDAVALISQHRDGELIARTARRLGFGAIRGSSTRGGAAALWEMRQALGRRHLLITPDGPRGPRHVVKPGIIHLAQTLQRPIVFIGVAYDRFWQLSSWDRTCLPKPLGTIYAVFSEAIELPMSHENSVRSDLCCRIQERFIQLSRIAWHWSRTEQIPTPDLVLSPAS